MIRSAVSIVALALTTAPAALPAQAQTPAQAAHARVGEFAKPSQPERLEVLKRQMTAAGLTPTVEEFAGGGRGAARPGFNVTALLPGAGKEILLVAHYDAIHLRGGGLTDGVIDNAASVVAMIEAGRRLKGRTKHPVRIIITDQEELGLVGAQAWIRANGIGNIGAVINADVNGYGDNLMYGLNVGPQSTPVVDALKAVCAEKRLSCVEFKEYPPSDDRAFSAAGAPTVSIGHLPAAEAEELRIAMNEPAKAKGPPAILSLIHTENDRIEKVDGATVLRAADAFEALALKLDGQLP